MQDPTPSRDPRPQGVEATPPTGPRAATLATALARWREGDVAGLARLDDAALAAAPAADRGALAALAMSARLQHGDLEGARRAGELARGWGVSRQALARACLPAAERTLALAALASGSESDAREHLRRARDLADAGPLAGEAAGAVPVDVDPPELDAAFARLRETLAARASATAPAAPAWQPPRWIAGLAAECLAADDVHEVADRLLETVLREPDDRLAFHLAMSDGFRARQDPATALHFLGAAQLHAGAAQPRLVAELARRYGTLGRPDSAFDLVAAQSIEGGRALPLDPGLVRQLRAQQERLRQQTGAQAQHGHHVLLGHLQAHAEAFARRAASRPEGLTVIEIGTTRELIPGQGSTRQIAEFCLQHGLHFVTVDMDPHNGRMARETFAALGASSFQAVTMKGEDYLRECPGPIDVVFLDAYDFDHGHHSALRQSRYEKFLGSPIDDEQCHLMHLDCARTLVARLAPDGIVCFDDTWLEDGHWVAKGVLAMPYLLENGFRLLEARNHAALLGRAGTAE